MAAKRKATAIWEGNLVNGSGRVSLGTSGAATDLPVSWAARAEPAANGKTSPEELVAGALAACFSMALSAGLTKAGSPPERLQVEATSSFDKGDDGFSLTSMALSVQGRVPGIDEATFKQAAKEASTGCPLSRALRNNVEITVEATLE